jgi:four helix bundle protein
MPSIESYRDLRVWQEGMDLAEAVYRSRVGPRLSATSSLLDQMFRSAISIPANIAEGYGRESTGSYVQFLKIARGSLKELETHVLLAERIGFFESAKAEALLSRSERIGKMLNALINAIKVRRPAG